MGKGRTDYIVNTRVNFKIDNIEELKKYKNYMSKFGYQTKVYEKMLSNNKKQIREVTRALNSKGNIIDKIVKERVKEVDMTKKIQREEDKYYKWKNRMIANGLKATKYNFQEADRQLAKLKNDFDGSAMSVMFFGMAIKHTFQSIMNATVNTFTSIAQDLNENSVAISKLSANWMFLKFTVGDAIGSVIRQILPTITPIIQGISDWVERHKKLVGWITITGIILGGLMMTYGVLKLGIMGVIGTTANFINKLYGLNAVLGMTRTQLLLTAGKFTIFGILVGYIAYKFISTWTKMNGNWIQKTLKTLVRFITYVALILEAFKAIFKSAFIIVGAYFTKYVFGYIADKLKKLIESIAHAFGANKVPSWLKSAYYKINELRMSAEDTVSKGYVGIYKDVMAREYNQIMAWEKGMFNLIGGEPKPTTNQPQQGMFNLIGGELKPTTNQPQQIVNLNIDMSNAVVDKNVFLEELKNSLGEGNANKIIEYSMNNL